MTRFARAKGSKSSNEKVPEEATPWSELKKGMLMKKETLDVETKKCVTAIKSKTEQQRPPEWVSLDDVNDDSLTLLKKHLEKRRGGKAVPETNESINSDHNVKGKKRKLDETEEKVGQEKNKKKGKIRLANNGEAKASKKKRKVVNVNAEAEEESKLIKKRKKLNKNENNYVNKKKKISNADVVTNTEKEEITVKKKRKLKGKTVPENIKQIEQDTEKMLKKKKIKTFAGEKVIKKNSTTPVANQGRIVKKKSKMFHKNRNKFEGSKFTTKINVGGESVSITKYQGFYVTTEDAKRLKDLKKKMVAEGIPESQIEAAIKLERRRCEKSLARMKKNVCFQCRKPGHMLSQCPELQDNVETSTGVCYKCGSTEHKAFTCKVTQGKNFPFAECFICKEKGHIARECPDNPRGLYPKGGCCKICGDVTHLKKDCPKRIADNEEKTIKLQLRDDRNLEGLEEIDISPEAVRKKKSKKPVHF